MKGFPRRQRRGSIEGASTAVGTRGRRTGFRGVNAAAQLKGIFAGEDQVPGAVVSPASTPRLSGATARSTPPSTYKGVRPVSARARERPERGQEIRALPVRPREVSQEDPGARVVVVVERPGPRRGLGRRGADRDVGDVELAALDVLLESGDVRDQAHEG